MPWCAAGLLCGSGQPGQYTQAHFRPDDCRKLSKSHGGNGPFPFRWRSGAPRVQVSSPGPAASGGRYGGRRTAERGSAFPATGPAAESHLRGREAGAPPPGLCLKGEGVPPPPPGSSFNSTRRHVRNPNTTPTRFQQPVTAPQPILQRAPTAL